MVVEFLGWPTKSPCVTSEVAEIYGISKIERANIAVRVGARDFGG